MALLVASAVRSKSFETCKAKALNLASVEESNNVPFANATPPL